MSIAERGILEADLAARPGLRPWTAFGLCAAILVAVTIAVFITSRGTFLDKDPVPLHKSLSQIEKSQLGAYQVIDAMILSDEMTEALGTKQYIQWMLQDTRRSSGDPLRHVILFVTYYTGGRTLVPHTPERCHLGQNWATKASWATSFEIPGLEDPAQSVKVPAQVLVFNKAGLLDVQERTVVYTFYANCGFAADRSEIRWWLSLPGVSKSFFSKVEVTFAGGEMGITNPDPKQAAGAAVELLQTVLPVLVRDHWPRKEELQKDEVPATR